jgi:large subunit ribosomal protein L21
MLAIIKTGGKQYKVSAGQVLKVESLEALPGDVVSFDQVLMIADENKNTVGAPFIKGATVTAEVMTNGRAKKICIIKMKRRKHHMKRQGHRQNFTQVKITGIAQ